MIGFDADHCIVKYKVKELMELLISSELLEMRELGYPKEILDFNIQDEEEMCLNASVFDMDNGTVIKMAENRLVIRAMKGFRVLSTKEIESIYGSPPIYKQYVWPNTSNITDKKGGYWVFLTFFDTPKVALVLSAINLKERGLLNHKTYYDIACDIRTLVYQNYIHYNDKEVKSIANYGRYFPEVLKNPEKYIQP